MIENSRSQLGDFLRSRREKLQPQDVGLTDGRRRRTAGLRREEVAELAGISVDWYVRLEQGRSVNPSISTINALARALKLSKVEHLHIKNLTRSGERRGFQPESIPHSLQRMIDAMKQPAYVTGQRWDLLGWNKAANDLFAFDQLAGDERNTLISMLTRPSARKLFGAAWADQAKRLVAEFRATHDLWADDPAFRDLLQRVRKGCPEFSVWWKTHDIRRTAAGIKRLHHPKKGVLSFEHASFQSNDDPSLRVVIYTLIRPRRPNT
ncbi:helix-turn-helix transcriptional regulator [Bradyrhizobium sp. LHD-71]|uniref:helix-turn-helix transcriptional regulator n=1 Tax=Bradyrhizobium sp. LHD-71 TaxID=3072141 RepID=UPI0035BE8135